jgi:hypothetical protein
MTADARWSPDGDPPQDPVIARLLRDAGDLAPLSEAEADRLEVSVMVALRREAARGRLRAPAWWEVTAQWLPMAAAAGLAAVLLSAAVFLAAALSGAVADDETAPETAAVAQVLDRYPGDAVLASLLAGGRPDVLSPWSEP